MSFRLPFVMPLGDAAVLVRFSDSLEDDANLAAVGFAHRLQEAGIPGVTEIVPNLISVLIRYDPHQRDFQSLSGDIRLALSRPGNTARQTDSRRIDIPTRYGGDLGPDLAEVADLAGLTPKEFIAAHASADLRVLATGFAPGFVYCGFHDGFGNIKRRTSLRSQVAAGTILFAAGQTAVAATPIPTGWHVIGHTDFSNFEPKAMPPTHLQAGDRVRFVEAVS